jgi:hypothetical protein
MNASPTHNTTGEGIAPHVSDEARFNSVAVSIAGEMPDWNPIRVHGTGAYHKIQLIPRHGSGIYCMHAGGFTRDNVSSYASFGSYRCLSYAELTEALEAGDLTPQWVVGVSL